MELKHLRYSHKHGINRHNTATIFAYEPLKEGGRLHLNKAPTGFEDFYEALVNFGVIVQRVDFGG